MDNLSNDCVGRIVRFTSEKAREKNPNYFPKVGTLGIIKQVHESNKIAIVKWAKDSTSDDDEWYVSCDYIELVNKNDNSFKEKSLNIDINDIYTGKRVVLTNTAICSDRRVFAGSFGTIKHATGNFMLVKFDDGYENYINKKNIGIVSDERYEKGDKVVCVKATLNEDDDYYPKEGEFFEYCGTGFYYRPTKSPKMGKNWFNLMQKNHAAANLGLSYVGVKFKKVVSFC